MNIIVSACLLGEKCRYDGKCFEYSEIEKLKNGNNIISVCPEVLGGLLTPRSPAERKCDKVLTKAGNDVTKQYSVGAEEVLALAKEFNCNLAVFKSRSPSCGNSQIYDGTFQGKVINGSGVCAELLIKNGIKVFNENEIDKVKEVIENDKR